MSKFWKKIKRGLLMTHDEMWHRLSTAVSSGEPSEIMEVLEEVLIGADVGVDLAGELLDGLDQSSGEWETIRSILSERIMHLFSGVHLQDVKPGRPEIVLLVGVNGSGKTTTAAKLAARMSEKGLSPLLAAADTFRAGAVEQLKIWGERIHVPVVAHGNGSDPAAVVFDALQAAVSRGSDALIIDTAGRLHTKTPLMDELAKIVKIIKRHDEAAPHRTLLVLDATTGQNGLAQAQEFLNAVNVNGIVLTKLDGTAKGGVIVHIVHSLKLPVLYVGVGEGVDDLVPFDPEDFTHALLRGE